MKNWMCVVGAVIVLMGCDTPPLKTYDPDRWDRGFAFGYMKARHDQVMGNPFQKYPAKATWKYHDSLIVRWTTGTLCTLTVVSWPEDSIPVHVTFHYIDTAWFNEEVGGSK